MEGVDAIQALIGATGVGIPALISFIAFNLLTIPCFAAVATARAVRVGQIVPVPGEMTEEPDDNCGYEYNICRACRTRSFGDIYCAKNKRKAYRQLCRMSVLKEL